MRILTIANCPALEHLGSGYVIANFVSGMRESGHQVTLLQPDDYEICQQLRPKAISYRQALGMLLGVRKELKRNKYDVVEFWGGEAWAATEWLLRQQNRPMIVQHTNGPEPRHNRMLRQAGALKLSRMQSWHADKLLPRAFARVDGIVTVSHDDLGWLEQSEQPECGKRRAVEVPLAACFLDRPLKARATRAIGFCGSWIPKKGIAVLAWDLTRILREYSDWRFVALGTDVVDSVLSCFPDELRSRVEIVPMMRNKEDLARAYENIEIFVLPSLAESFGVALAEAMACGCASVTTHVGFGASLNDGEEALIMEKPESPYLYRAVKRLIADSGLRQRVRAAGRQRVQHLRWDRAIRTLAATYESWLGDFSRAAERIPQRSWACRVARVPRPERI
jgi:glycosyltransferase involved in cell wall biosynthesis